MFVMDHERILGLLSVESVPGDVEMGKGVGGRQEGG